MKFRGQDKIKRRLNIFQRIKICFVILICIFSFHLSGFSKRSTNVLTYLPIKKNANNSFEVAADIDALTIRIKRVGNLFLIDAIVDNQTGHLIFDTGTTGFDPDQSLRNHHRCQQ